MTRRTRMEHEEAHGRDQAASPVVGFLVALGIFTFALVAVLNFAATPEPGGSDSLSDELRVKALDSLQLMLQDPGFTATGEVAWDKDPDALSRFGLALPGQPNVLDYDKIQKLREAKTTADGTNGIADYPEVRDALGVEDTYEFHLRTYPVFLSVEDSEWSSFKGLHAAYIGHGESGVSSTANVVWSTSNATGHLQVDATVTNTDTTPMVYKVSFELQMSGGVLSVDDQYTKHLWPGDSQTVQARYHEVPDWAGLGTVEVKVYDAYANELTDRRFVNMTFPEDASATEYNLLVDPANYYFRDTDTATFYLDHYDGNGERVKVGNSGPDVQVVVVAPNGTETVNTTVELPHNKALSWDCPAGSCDTVGNHTVKVMTTGNDRVVKDTFYVSDTDLFPVTKTLTNDAKYEAGLLDELIARFENSTYDPDTAEGDIFLDERTILTDHLVSNLTRYDLLIIGSNVDHNELTSGSIKWGIHDWVVEDGGHLVVLGSVSTNTQFLQPLYGSGISTANGGISTPDPTHPTLHVPEELRYSTYADNGVAWKLTSNADDYYTHVIAKDGSGNQIEDTLAMSIPGAFGNGSVLLTSYLPADLTDPQDHLEARKFMNNMVATGYNMVFIDFGPEIPSGVTVSSASRVAIIPHPSLPDAQVEVKVLMYVWR